jgi:integrase
MRVWWNDAWHHLGLASDEPGWRAEYARLLARWSRDPHAGTFDPKELLVGVLFRDYLKSADAPTGKDRRHRVKTVARLLGELHPETPVAAFGPVEFRAWQSWVCALPDPDDPARTRFNATSVRDFRAVVKAVWKWGVATERVKPDRHLALCAVPPPKPGEVRAAARVEPADPADVLKVLPLLPPAVRAIVLLIRLTGARPTEILTLRPGDVDRSGDPWVYTPDKHKGTWRGKPRAVYLNAEAQTVLAPWLDGCGPEAFAFTPARSEAARLAALPRATPRYPSHMRRNAEKRVGRATCARYSHRSLDQAVRRACAKAGVKLTPYQLRHLLASEVRQTHGLEAVRAVLGHSYKAMSDHYSASADREIAEKVMRSPKPPPG